MPGWTECGSYVITWAILALAFFGLISIIYTLIGLVLGKEDK